MKRLYFDQLSGIEFEEYLLRVFNRLGYEGMTTQASGDFGADLLIKKDNTVTVVQAKRYLDPVGISAVQEIIGAKNYYSADQCMVVTTSSFTPSAVALARANDVELWDRQQLINSITQSFGSTPGIEMHKQEHIPPPLPTWKEIDQLFIKAVSATLQIGQASVSYLQRQLRIGYTRAAIIIDQMEALGIIEGYKMSEPRKLLMTETEIKEKIKSLKEGV